MEYGAHLPLIDFDGEGQSLAKLVDFAEVANGLGYRFLCANDHLVFSRPWLDGPTALAAVLGKTGKMTLATTVALPVIRGPAVAAKALAAIDILSGGRLLVGVGPGSSPRDYAAVDLPFEERWKRLDEAVKALRRFWSLKAPELEGKFYSTKDTALEPYPAREGGPPIWIGSWGSPAGLRRVARLGDGWLASGYNTTPERFVESHRALGEELLKVGKEPAAFPNGMATMWMYDGEPPRSGPNGERRPGPFDQATRRGTSRSSPDRACGGVREEARCLRARRGRAHICLAAHRRAHATPGLHGARRATHR